MALHLCDQCNKPFKDAMDKNNSLHPMSLTDPYTSASKPLHQQPESSSDLSVPELPKQRQSNTSTEADWEEERGFMYASAPEPRVFRRWNVAAVRVMGLKRGRWFLEQRLPYYFAIYTFPVGLLLIQLVMFGVLTSPGWSIFICIDFLSSTFLCSSFFNLDVLVHLVFQFDLLFAEAYWIMMMFVLLPDLCAWDVRALMFIAFGFLGGAALLVDAQATILQVKLKRLCWLATIPFIVACVIGVQLSLWEVHPRNINIGITTIRTDALFSSVAFNSLIFNLKFVLVAFRYPGRLVHTHSRIVRSDLLEAWNLEKAGVAPV